MFKEVIVKLILKKHVLKFFLIFCFVLYIITSLYPQDFRVKYSNYQNNENANLIIGNIIIENKTWQNVLFSDIELRYYLTNEDDKDQLCNVSVNAIPSELIDTEFVLTDDNNGYFRITFKEESGVLEPKTSSHGLNMSIHKTDWSDCDQSNDYSFIQIYSGYTLHDKIVLFYKGVQKWGVTPDDGLPDYLETNLEPDNNNDWLSADGTSIVDDEGNPVRITGINYFGFETANMVFQGLWSSDLEINLDTIAHLGFNLIRVPLSVELVDKWLNGEPPMPSEGSVNTWQKNEYLSGMNSLEVFDYAVNYCKNIGLKIMLDMHEVLKDRKRNIWYYAQYTEEDFIECWKWLADRYKSDDTIIAMDLFNEPHGKVYLDDYAAEGDPVIWNGSEKSNNWKNTAEKTAKEILSINPNLLIMVEGIHSYPKNPLENDFELTAYNDRDEYWENWWGGNLRGVELYPVDLGEYQHKLVYEPHDYGPRVWSGHPWFRDEMNKEILFNECWQPNWFFIYENGIAPLLIGEWGCKMDMELDIRWFKYFAEFITENQLSYTYWCFNPNSHDTGGIIKDDYVTIEWEKYDIIKPTLWLNNQGKGIGLDHEIKLGGNGSNISEYYNPSIPDTD